MGMPSSAARCLVGVVAATVCLMLAGCRPEPVSTAPSMAATSSPSASATAAEPSPSTVPTPSPAPTRPPEPTDDPVSGLVTLTTVGVQDGAVEAAAVVTVAPGDDGTCTLIAERDGTRREASGTATSGGESVFCGLLSIPLSDLSSGEWAISMAYSSSTASAVSAPSTVVVP